MKNSRVFLMIAIVLVLLVSACPGGNPLQPPNCKRGTCVKVSLARSAKLGEDATLTLTLSSEVEDTDLQVYLDLDPEIVVKGNTDVIAGYPTWKVHAKPSQPVTINVNLRFPREGYQMITAHVLTNVGGDAFDGLRVHVTAGGITPNPPPERGPGTPAPAYKFDKTPTPRPQTPTPIPPPTQPAYP